MDYKLKEIILNYFTSVCDDEIQATIAKYENDSNGDERIRERLSEELSRLLYDDTRLLPEHVADLPEVHNYLEALLQYVKDNADVDELISYIDWD